MTADLSPPCPADTAAAVPAAVDPIEKHEGAKYLRTIWPAGGQVTVDPADDRLGVQVDVYAVLVAFGVTCPARQHAVKKLLCAGLRGKGSEVDDLTGALAAVSRAVELQLVRERDKQTGEVPTNGDH